MKNPTAKDLESILNAINYDRRKSDVPELYVSGAKRCRVCWQWDSGEEETLYFGTLSACYTYLLGFARGMN
jgi:hypothetical protein